MVNNSKVRDALTAPKWDGGGEYGHASEMVHRLLNVEMDYLTFATTGLQEGDHPVEKDLNLEYSMCSFFQVDNPQYELLVRS